MTLEWKQESPTEIGRYWIKEYKDSPVSLVEVAHDTQTNVLIIIHDNSLYLLDDSGYSDSWFAKLSLDDNHFIG